MKLAVVTCLLSFAVLCSAYRSNEETIDLIKHLLASRDYLKESMERKLLTYGPPEPRSKIESLKKEMSSKVQAERFNLAINQCANSFKDTLNVGTLKQGWFVYPKPQAPFIPPQAQLTATKADDDGNCAFSIHADPGYTLFVFISTTFSVDQPDCAPGKALDIYAGDSSETDPPDGSICASMSGWLHFKDTGVYIVQSEKEIQTNALLIIHHPKVSENVNFYIYYKFIKSSTIVTTRPPIVMIPEFHESAGEIIEKRRINFNERREFQ